MKPISAVCGGLCDAAAAVAGNADRLCFLSSVFTSPRQLLKRLVKIALASAAHL